MIEKRTESRQTNLIRRLRNRFASLALLLALVLPAAFASPSAASELTRIGVTVTDLGNPFFVRIARGVENAARRITGKEVKVFVASSAYDLARQNEQIDGFIRKKVDLIVLIATDPLAIEPSVRQAQAAGIGAFLVKPVSQSSLADARVQLFTTPEELAAVVQATGEAQTLAGLRLLLAEDNDINQQIAQELLESAGARVDIA